MKRFLPRNLPRAHAALAVEIPFLFVDLNLGVMLVDSHGWHALQVAPSVLQLEQEHSQERLRVDYNHRSMLEAVRSKKPVVTRHVGFYDIFVPVVNHGAVDQMLAAGPFRRAHLTSADLQEWYFRVTGRRGSPSDPGFSDYVTSAIETPIFEGSDLEALKRLMVVFARLIGHAGDANRLAAELEACRKGLEHATFTRRAWRVARSMTSPLEDRVWRSRYLAPQRAELGLRQLPEHVVVALIAGKKDEKDPVDEAIRRDEFQRACVRLAATRGDRLSGPVGTQGVFFLLPGGRSSTRVRTETAELIERVVALGQQRFRLRLHCGSSLGSSGSTLPQRYRAALAAAEQALSQGVSSVHAADTLRRTENAARDLRMELANLEGDALGGVRVRFDRYIDVVANETRYRVDLAAVHLSAGLERLVEPFIRNGTFDMNSWRQICASLDTTTNTAATAHELFAAYRAAVSDLEAAVRRPASLHQEQSLRKAHEFIREHLGERLSRASVARVAGFEPHYFSRLFKQREKLTLGAYVTKLRIERAQEMLARTELSAERIAKLSGFSSSQYFHQVFKQVVGETPRDYRQRPG